MTPEAIQLVLSAKADEIVDLAPSLGGLIVLASAVDPTDGATCMHCFLRGNRHAVIAAVEEWLLANKNYDAGYKEEQGRYDAVVHRQRQQERA